MFVVGGIQTALFLGGWNSPLGPHDPVYMAIGYDPVAAGQAYFNGTLTGGWAATAQAMGLSSIGLVLLNLYATFLFVLKIFTIVFTLIWLRWTLPRIRIDQVLYTCVKVLLPLSLVLFAGTAVWVWAVPQPAAAGISGNPEPSMMLGHLVSLTPQVQLITQTVLALLGIAVAAAVVAVPTWAYITRDQRTFKSFFPDVMPVGSEIAFTSGPAAATEQAEAEPAAS